MKSALGPSHNTLLDLQAGYLQPNCYTLTPSFQRR